MFSGSAVEKTLALPQLQLVEKSDSFYGLRIWQSLVRRSPLMYRFMGNDFWMFPVFSAIWFNSGYMLRQFTEAFGNNFTRFRPSYFSAMLGSTADSRSCVRLRSLLRFTLQKTAKISAVAAL